MHDQHVKDWVVYELTCFLTGTDDLVKVSYAFSDLKIGEKYIITYDVRVTGKAAIRKYDLFIVKDITQPITIKIPNKSFLSNIMIENHKDNMGKAVCEGLHFNKCSDSCDISNGEMRVTKNVRY